MPLPIAVTGMTREKTKAMMRLRTPRMSAPRCSAGCKEAGRLLGIVSAPIIQPGSARIAMGEEGQRGFHLMLRVMPPSQTLLQWHRSINAHRKPKGYERWTSQILADRAKTRCVRSRREPIFAIFSALLSPRGREIRAAIAASCALRPSRVAAPDDRNPHFAMFRPRIDQCRLRGDYTPTWAARSGALPAPFLPFGLRPLSPYPKFNLRHDRS